MGGEQICGNAALLPQHRYNADIFGSIKSTLSCVNPGEKLVSGIGRMI
jgi:hypothetical protein